MEDPQQVHVPDYNPTDKRPARRSKECINRKLIPPKILLMTFYGGGCMGPAPGVSCTEEGIRFVVS